MVTYSTNWMGPVSLTWYADRGLLNYVWKTADTEELANMYRVDVGEKYMVAEVTTHYSAGRIDVRDNSKEGYDGWDEYSLAPMTANSWNKLSDWLWDLETTEVWDYDMLISIFEGETGHKIEWWIENT